MRRQRDEEETQASQRASQRRRRDEEEEEEEENDEAVEEEDPAMDERLEDFLTREQTQEDKRRLRREYRDLQADLEEHKLEWLKPNSDGLSEAIARANRLFSEVKSTQEASLDAKILVAAAEVGVLKVANMSLAGKAFDIDAYVDKVAKIMRNGNGDGRNDDDDDGQKRVEFDWSLLGKIAAQHMKRAPTIGFMLGPLLVEPKEKKEVRRVAQRLQRDKNDLVKPQEMKEADIERQENETSKVVGKIAKILKKKGPTNFFEFAINPESFSQSVENLFYVSFLIRDGSARIDIDESGQPVL
ncbi:nuclear protein, partial [Blyttiomyces sp. JEL0837]